MMRITQWITAVAVVALVAGQASAANTVAFGKIKSVSTETSSFVLTDVADKDHTFKFDGITVNRGGKETKNDIKVGDSTYVCYEKGTFSWTAHYILVQEGDTKTAMLVTGTVMAFDASKNELTLSNEQKADSTYAVGKASIRFNMEAGKFENVAKGDPALWLINTVDNKQSLVAVMVHRAAK